MVRKKAGPKGVFRSMATAKHPNNNAALIQNKNLFVALGAISR
jgi:hypothetical protein